MGHKRIVKLSRNATDEEPAPQTGLTALRINISVVGDSSGRSSNSNSVVGRLRSVAVFGSAKCSTHQYEDAKSL